MEKEQQIKQFLEQQLKRCKEQDDILEKIETALYEMKEIAEYAAENQLNSFETRKLEAEMDQLKEEIASFEKLLHPTQIIH